MADKFCADCKWVTFNGNHRYNCLNPMNDDLYDWFNPSTGDVIRDIRRSSITYELNTCTEFVAEKKNSPSSK